MAPSLSPRRLYTGYRFRSAIDCFIAATLARDLDRLVQASCRDSGARFVLSRNGDDSVPSRAAASLRHAHKNNASLGEGDAQ
jgi:hypothetical protein